jgi:integrase
MTIDELCRLYLDHAHSYYRKPKSKRLTSEYSLIELSLVPLRRVAGPMPVQDVTPVTLAQARQWILDNLPNNSRGTVNGKVSRMVRVFRWGAQPERGYVPELVCSRLLMVKPLPYGRSSARETPGLSALSRDKINDFLISLFDPPPNNWRISPATELARKRISVMVRLQVATGMRSGELCSMTVEAIDHAGPSGTWIYRPTEHKTEHRGKTRVIPLFQTEQNLITRWMNRAHVLRGPLFGVRVDSYRTAIKRALKRAGMEPWTPHQLRHTAATEIRRGAGLDAAQVLLGHASVRTTETYAEVGLGETVSKIEAYHRAQGLAVQN